MKRSLVVLIISLLLSVMVISGCLDYKAYDLPQDDLVDEIAQVEQELGTAEETSVESGEEQPEVAEEVVEEEVVLPELSDEEAEEEPAVVDDSTVRVKENEMVRLKVRVRDPDNDKVTYSYSKPLNSLGEWKTNYGDAGEYMVTISATDGKLTTEKKVKLVVQRVNVPPTIPLLRDIVVKEGETVTFAPNISDPNKDKVTVTISEPLNKKTFVTDHTSAGEYQITVTATDGELTSEKMLKLVVVNVNVPPELSGVADVKVKEGQTVTIKPVVKDIDEDKVTLSITDPVGSDGIWNTGYTDHGEYFVTVTASDGKDKVSQRVKVTVEDVNMPPEITDVTLVK